MYTFFILLTGIVIGSIFESKSGIMKVLIKAFTEKDL